MQSEAYQKIGRQTFRICAGCAGVPLLLVLAEHVNYLCEQCKHERNYLLIKRWEAKRELDTFPREMAARKALSFERRVRIANLITQIQMLNERLSDGYYKAKKLLEVSKKEARSRSNTGGLKAQCAN